MASAAAQIVLTEADVELTLLGSLFVNDGAFDQFAFAIKPEWFGDELARYLFEQCMKIHEAGNRLTPPTIMAALPEDLGGISRGNLYAKVCANGLPTSSIPGLLFTLKDRWARRSIIDMADQAKDAAVRFEADPYMIASDCMSAIDIISDLRAEKVGGSFTAAADELFEDLMNVDQLRGATTGLRVLDSKLNGYKRGQLYVIAARPGMGKSAYMASSLRRTAESGVGVAIYSLEMTRQEVAARMLSDACDTTSGPMFGNILKGQIKPEQEEMLVLAKQGRAKMPMHIDPSARLTFAEIAGRARRLKAEMAKHGVTLGVVCIDHMGLVSPSGRYAGNKVAEAGEISGQARVLAKELDCCVVLLCQLSREVEKRDDKRPVMSDLRWSGEIEQDAHVIGFLYRDEYYLSQEANPDPTKLMAARWSLDFLIRKNRNGETGDVRLWCSIAHSSIRDVQ